MKVNILFFTVKFLEKAHVRNFGSLKRNSFLLHEFTHLKNFTVQKNKKKL